MAEKSIIIIGAGLAAGCYARMNGYKTRIFELHNTPGGLCTSWERCRAGAWLIMKSSYASKGLEERP